MSKTTDGLHQVLANTYALYLKTQGYHWNVRGSNFFGLHKMFESQYEELAEAVDEVAERIVSLGVPAQAGFKDYDKLTNLSPADVSLDSQAMLKELAADHEKVVSVIHDAIKVAESVDDEATADMLIGRVETHQKAIWMLKASIG